MRSFGTSNPELRTSDRAFLAHLARHASRFMAAADFFSILLTADEAEPALPRIAAAGHMVHRVGGFNPQRMGHGVIICRWKCRMASIDPFLRYDLLLFRQHNLNAVIVMFGFLAAHVDQETSKPGGLLSRQSDHRTLRQFAVCVVL